MTTAHAFRDLKEEELNELIRLKTYYPYRIVSGVIRLTGEFEAYATKTMHIPNRLTKEGHKVRLISFQ